MKYALFEITHIDGFDYEKEIYDIASLDICCDTIEIRNNRREDIIDEYIEQDNRGREEIRRENCYVRYEIYPNIVIL